MPIVSNMVVCTSNIVKEINLKLSEFTKKGGTPEALGGIDYVFTMTVVAYWIFIYVQTSNCTY